MINFIKDYKKNGFTIFRSYLDSKIIEAITREAKNIFGLMLKKNNIHYEVESDESFTFALFNLFEVNYSDFLGAAKAVQHILTMHRLSVSDEIINLVKSVGLIQPIICVKPIIYFNSRYLAKIEGHYKTPAHQDWRSMQGSLNSIVVWIPLIDIGKSLGAVEFITGSHLKGLLATEKDEWFRFIPEHHAPSMDFIPAEVNVGDVVLFSSFTVHRSGNNVTDKIRWSMHFRYNDALDKSFLNRGMPHPYVIYKPEQQIITEGFPTPELLEEVFK